MIEKQRCNECGGVFDVDRGFRLKKHAGLSMPSPDYHGSCKGCEGKRRQRARKADPFIQKAQYTTRHHAKRYGMSIRAFVATYGWDVHRVAHLLRHAFDNTCAYCRQPYKAMTNGLREVTLDIGDPREKPFLDTNTTPCCNSCNCAKRDLPPETWARQLLFWREWEANQKRRVMPAQLDLAL
jgi:hypothetical protein